MDVTRSKDYEVYLYKCLAPMPFRKYRRRVQYLGMSVPKGFHKKVMLLNGNVVGQIEYAPAGVSGLPISGDRVIVMNCIWVLRKAKGYNLAKALLLDSIRDKTNAMGFAAIALVNHPSPWMKKGQMEKLGFVSIDSLRLRHRVKHRGISFKVHLMWLPLKEKAQKPSWNTEDLLKGVTFCMAHPLYNPESAGLERIFEKC